MNSSPSILFVDDEQHIRAANQQTLDLAGLTSQTFERAETALPMITRDWPGVLITDIRLPGMDGLELLAQTHAIDPDIPVILITGHGDVSTAVKAMRGGAYDFIEKPYPAERLIDTVQRALDKRALVMENRNLRVELMANTALGPRIIGRSPEMCQLRATIARIADTGADVLIFGETGTGKELVARSLHEHSRRRDCNFVAVNCGAVPETMIESELFGHEAGAFTGAKSKRIGKFEHAHRGTLFLDEIESMPASAQVQLLRVVQERAIERLGSNQLIPLDFRVVAATKVDLREAANQGSFREDLYYRLNVVTLHIPPLRNRRDDIPLLFHHFLLVAQDRFQRDAPFPAQSEVSRLIGYDWPGNVRELRNLTERYVLLGEQFDWSLADLLATPMAGAPRTLPEQIENFEKSLIVQALAFSKGCIKDTMTTLGIPRKTLYDKMQKYQLDKDDYKA
ncbi:two component, sigma54 specific, transcriptional regulator, Fis family [Thiorhodococcus drewsii AZ1]|uniref:Two component, sigma54 specific, transcriptional regulator, Fis family n=1 Tax=Thiorhodococcus drewsii AZ1 TaxID=765913 RepID=G2DZF2_9GAMM|nr:sigma-54 dependent transcriptional regulator [Thiorhodococcus drewsii]EGV32179.1 two component, sigma54 specific, transcriptional regulator, Fis family [Thiorhodococcus drewsii AZ1]